MRSAGDALPDVWSLDVPAGDSGASPSTPKRLTDLNADALADVELVRPVERWVTVDGRSVQGWYVGPASAGVPFSIFISWQTNPTNLGRHNQDVAVTDGDSRVALIHRTLTVYP